MTPEEFSAKIKEKYPVYANMDDTELAQKIVNKYPVYKDKVNFGIEPTLRGQGTYQGEVGAEQVAGVKKVEESLSKGFESIKSGMKEGGLSGVPDVLKGIVGGAAGTITGVGQAGFAPVTPIISKLIPPIAEKVVPVLRQQNPELAKIYDTVVPKLSDWAEKNPENATIASDVINSILLLSGGKAAEPALKEALTKEGIQATKESLSGVPGAIKESLITPKPNELQQIAEKITPKPTIKEAKLATEQGRLYKGKEATTFGAKTIDKVALTDQQAQSARTISKLIPDAAKMDEPTLYAATKEKIAELSTQLKPEMQKVPLKPETVQKLNADWSALKKIQLKEAIATEEPNVIKRQLQFEEILKKTNSDNLNDLWEARINYDNSIKPNVKYANDLSPESLQIQKDEWLQNRKVLNDAINDIENGLGATSRQAFSDMKDMFEAQRGILTKAKVNTKIEPAKAVEMGQKLIKTGVKGVIGGKLLGF